MGTVGAGGVLGIVAAFIGIRRAKYGAERQSDSLAKIHRGRCPGSEESKADRSPSRGLSQLRALTVFFELPTCESST